LPILHSSEVSLPQESNTADHNIVVTDPKRYFRDPDNYDMRHKQGSPAIDAGGVASAPKVDLDGVSRPQEAGWDFVDEVDNGTEDIWWILEGEGYPRLWWEAD